MPVASSIQELIDALRDRETNITRALDDLFGDPGTLAGHPNRPDLGTPYTLSSEPGDMLPPWATDELQGRSKLPVSPVNKPLKDDEIAHVNNWPPQLREDLRKVLHPRVAGGPHLKFHWELHGGDSEQIDDSVPGQMTFRTPQKNVRLSGWFANVKVKVGK